MRRYELAFLWVQTPRMRGRAPHELDFLLSYRKEMTLQLVMSQSHRDLTGLENDRDSRSGPRPVAEVMKGSLDSRSMWQLSSRGKQPSRSFLPDCLSQEKQEEGEEVLLLSLCLIEEVPFPLSEGLSQEEKRLTPGYVLTSRVLSRTREMVKT